MSVFDQGYSAGYDALYRDKDYGAECDLIARNLAPKPGARLLDVGCGTGGHAIELARRGYRVTGVDLSPHMLAAARGKAAAALGAKAAVDFQQGDARSFDVAAAGPFDGAVMMFAVLGYLSSNDDVLAALRNIRRHLVPGAPFAFDVWWGPAVLVQQPGDRVRQVPAEGGSLLRATRTTLDALNNTADVHFDLFHLSDNKPASVTRETHRMRYFFGPELQLLLQAAGFKLERIRQFPDDDATPTTDSWNVLVCATAA